MNRGLNDENGRTVYAPWPSVRTIISAFWSLCSSRYVIHLPFSE